MKYHVTTFGCQMNEADSQRLASEMEKLGLRATDKREEADVLVVNTCVVRQSAEDRAYSYLQSIRPLKRDNPNVVIGVMGCMVGVRGALPNGGDGLGKKLPFVDVFMPPSDPRPMVDFLLQREGRALIERETAERFALQDEQDGSRRDIGALPFLLPAHERGRRVTANVPIVYGCSHACSFCIIPFRRGVERSRPIPEIVAEVRALVEQGIKEVTLLGQIVDRYGYDLLGDDYAIRAYNPGAASGRPSQVLPIHAPLVDLLRQINDIDGLMRIRFLTSHPNWMTDELLDAVRELPKVMPHIEVPVQAGDDDVLHRMRRGYTADDYRALVERIRDKVPGCSIATDVIVGFCGETEAQFMRTYDLLEELRLDVIHIAKYSPRPHTTAARNFADDVPEEEKERRWQMLNDQHERISTQINARYQGQMVEVLVEDQHKGRWRGRTPTNKLVFFEDPDPNRDWRGRLVNVRITWTGPWSLQGIPVELPAAPSHVLHSQIALSLS
ncbi:MAG: MiaB/RimO family radical SAM methylthiotransferase [Anaerolineae bacterium]|nr:MiaB/RimO family radical SAM methylthiotransferase [Thermoflexales bacterium]MDW8406522.1 MiaB/RimO family radical SAM methylthiotransferase [Anaerolineae bacterium]